MSTTQHTSHYNLPTFGDNPNDRPSWRGDFTDAMTKIDNQMYANATNITTATAAANNATAAAQQAKESADNAADLAQANKTDIAELDGYFSELGVTSAQTAQNLMNTINGKAENTALTALQGTVSALSGKVDGKADSSNVYTKSQADTTFTKQGGYSGTAQQLNQLISENTTDISELEQLVNALNQWKTDNFTPQNIFTKSQEGVHGVKITVTAYRSPATGIVVIMAKADSQTLTTQWASNERVVLGTIPRQYAPTRAFEFYCYINSVNNIEMVLGVDTSGSIYWKNGRTTIPAGTQSITAAAEIVYYSGVGA